MYKIIYWGEGKNGVDVREKFTAVDSVVCEKFSIVSDPTYVPVVCSLNIWIRDEGLDAGREVIEFGGARVVGSGVFDGDLFKCLRVVVGRVMVDGVVVFDGGETVCGSRQLGNEVPGFDRNY